MQWACLHSPYLVVSSLPTDKALPFWHSYKYINMRDDFVVRDVIARAERASSSSSRTVIRVK